MKAFINLFRKDRRLGNAQGPHRYDLPLENDSGAGFLILLTALMTFLAALALAGAITLGSVTERWSSGLENKMTVEIPAEKSDGDLRSEDDIANLATQVQDSLKKMPTVRTVEILGKEEIHNLIKPWLGETASLAGIPLPGLVSLELTDSDPAIVKDLQTRLSTIHTDIRLDTHEEWLGSLLKIIGALQFTAYLITAVIGGITIIAVASAVRARMDVHREDVELLYLMGASDSYIARQFKRHAMRIALRGVLAGLVFAGVVLGVISMVASGQMQGALPDSGFGFIHIASLCALAAAICIIATQAAQFTVLRTLSRMP